MFFILCIVLSYCSPSIHPSIFHHLSMVRSRGQQPEQGRLSSPLHFIQLFRRNPESKSHSPSSVFWVILRASYRWDVPLNIFRIILWLFAKHVLLSWSLSCSIFLTFSVLLLYYGLLFSSLCKATTLRHKMNQRRQKEGRHFFSPTHCTTYK